MYSTHHNLKLRGNQISVADVAMNRLRYYYYSPFLLFSSVVAINCFCGY
jgi:hypothetical protein